MPNKPQIKPAVLIVDAAEPFATELCRSLGPLCGLVERADTPPLARALLERYHFDFLVADVGAEALETQEALDALVAAGGSAQLVALCSRPSKERAVAALRAGAVEFIEKPCSPDAVRDVVADWVQGRVRQRCRFTAPPVADWPPEVQGIVARSPAMREVLEMAVRVAQSSATVLIEGETGVGKEIVAQAIHAMSRRKGEFVPVNCGAIAPDLLESEFFGHVRGAYTGAHESRRGLFLHADRGTVFLDEITEMPLELQAKLLRTLEDRSVRPVGADREHRVDVRVIAATNRSVAEAVEQGRFRGDLYYRLNVLTFRIPPLRERPEDIVELAQHFSEALAAVHGVTPVPFDAAELERLQRYPWPGNVRELRNVIERAVLLGRLPSQCCESPQGGEVQVERTGYPTDWSMDAVERDHMLRVLAAHHGNKSAAARSLGISRKTLERKLVHWRGRDGAQAVA